MVIVQEIRRELVAAADATVKASGERFFREPVKLYGVRSSLVNAIARKHWKDAKSLGKAGVFRLCETLFKSGYSEEAFIAADYVPRFADEFVRADLALFERWIDSYIDNWAKCDSFCNHAVGDYVMRFPDEAKALRRWAKSGNRWMRRAAAVSLIVPAKKGMFKKDAFAIADILLLDKDDMVQKGYGWLLKEASRKHEDEVLEYVLRHKAVMPRTALRYAIELMPKEKKEKAMRKFTSSD